MLNKDIRVYRRRMIYINGSNRVVSFKLPEELVLALDRYVELLGFKNRSDLIRTLIVAFIYTMEQAEKRHIISNREMELSIEVKTSNGMGIRETIDIRSRIPFVRGIYEEVIEGY